VLDICGTPETQVGPVDDQILNLPAITPVTLRVARAVKVIGMPLKQQQCADAAHQPARDPLGTCVDAAGVHAT
jgi:phenylalanyl-tRNA synthetase beta chain